MLDVSSVAGLFRDPAAGTGGTYPGQKTGGGMPPTTEQICNQIRKRKITIANRKRIVYTVGKEVDMRDKDLVRKLTKKRGWSFEKLGDEMGVKSVSVRGYLNRGTTSMRCDTFYKIMDALGYDIVIRNRYNKREREYFLDDVIDTETEEHAGNIRHVNLLRDYDPSYYGIVLDSAGRTDAEKQSVPEPYWQFTTKTDWLIFFNEAIDDLKEGGYIKGKAQKSNPYYWEKQIEMINLSFPDGRG